MDSVGCRQYFLGSATNVWTHEDLYFTAYESYARMFPAMLAVIV